MKNNHSNNIAAVSVGLRENRYGSEYTEICSRFFCSAAMLRDRDSLGLQIRFSGKKGTEIVAFSDTALSLKDYAWIFQPGADVTAASAKDLRYPDGTVMYSFSDSGPFPAESRTGVIQLTEELRGLGAILTVTVSRTEPSRCSVTLHSPVPLPLRVLVMVSCLFQGEAAESTSGKEGMGSLLPAKTVSEAITALFYAISSRSGETEEEEFAELIPEDQYPEDTPIEELSLSVRAFNCLKRAGIHTLKELRAMSEDDLRRVRNLGKKCFEEVLAKRRKCSPLPEEEEEKEQETTKEPGKSGRELLDELIGLDGVKRQVRRIAALAVMQQDMKEKGMEHTPVTLNMAFVGNPGTAKTTAARIMAKILYEAGFLKNPQVTEVGRADLVGQYAGQTAKCVQNVFQSAKGGLLFIDEAYSLLEEWHNGYGDEAINTIVQEMENKREDTVVVFAGYPGPMEDFFARNPGIRSRIPFILPFADYSVTEMMQIAVLEAKKRGFSVSPDAAEALEGLFAEGRKSEENGNGRFCRNLIENAILSYAERIWGEGAGTGTNDYILQKEDFADCRIRSGKSAGTIGFLAP